MKRGANLHRQRRSGSASLSLLPWTILLALSLVLLTLAGCGGSAAMATGPGSSGATPTPAPTPAPIPTPTPSPQKFNQVVLVILENQSYQTVFGGPTPGPMPYLNGLANQYGMATNYFANAHPSLPNYFMLTTGQTITQDDNFAGIVSADTLVRRMLAGGITWKGYLQSIPSAGYLGGDVFPYVKHHNPLAYFSEVTTDPSQAANLVNLSQWSRDLSGGTLPRFALLVPDIQHDAHSCPVTAPVLCTNNDKLAAADSWLRDTIDPFVNSATFKQSGLVIVTFDEAEQSDMVEGGGKVPFVIAGAGVKSAYRSVTLHRHQDTLRLVLESLGLNSDLGAASQAGSMGEFFSTPQ